ncbi:MAG: hypothetical protein ACREJN_18380 [Nitrospiraceae bacterium]
MEPDEPLLTPELLELIKASGHKFCSSGYDRVLLDEARLSAERAEVARQVGDTRHERGASASAVLCSAAACEARLSEYLAHWEFASGPLPEDLEGIRKVWDAREQWRILIKNRAPEFELGSSREYLRFGCLLRLRDLVAHRNARLQRIGDVPNRISDCVRQGVIPVAESGGDWPSIVLISPVAAWSIETCSAWLDLADQLVPLTC